MDKCNLKKTAPFNICKAGTGEAQPNKLLMVFCNLRGCQLPQFSIANVFKFAHVKCINHYGAFMSVFYDFAYGVFTLADTITDEMGLQPVCVFVNPFLSMSVSDSVITPLGGTHLFVRNICFFVSGNKCCTIQ